VAKECKENEGKERRDDGKKRGRSKSRIKNAQAASQRASEAMASSSCWLSGSYLLGNEIPEEAPTRRRTAKKKSEEEGRRGVGGVVVRPLGVASTCFL